MLAGAETRKQKANALFKQGKFNEAVDMYDAILTNLATIPKSKSSKSAPIVKVRFQCPSSFPQNQGAIPG